VPRSVEAGGNILAEGEKISEKFKHKVKMK